MSDSSEGNFDDIGTSDSPQTNSTLTRPTSTTQSEPLLRYEELTSQSNVKSLIEFKGREPGFSRGRMPAITEGRSPRVRGPSSFISP